jgi:hypothetical protein
VGGQGGKLQVDCATVEVAKGENMVDLKTKERLLALCDEAEQKGLYVTLLDYAFTGSMRFWFTPAELRKQMSLGYYVWDARWELLNPLETAHGLTCKINHHTEQIQKVTSDLNDLLWALARKVGKFLT